MLKFKLCVHRLCIRPYLLFSFKTNAFLEMEFIYFVLRPPKASYLHFLKHCQNNSFFIFLFSLRYSVIPHYNVKCSHIHNISYRKCLVHGYLRWDSHESRLKICHFVRILRLFLKLDTPPQCISILPNLILPVSIDTALLNKLRANVK
jgi:hypothetical protein